MNATQTNYISAKIADTTARTLYGELMNAIDGLRSEDRAEYKRQRAQIEVELGLSEKRATLIAAEDALLNWAQVTVRRNPAYTADHDMVFDATRTNYRVRATMLENSVRLDS